MDSETNNYGSSKYRRQQLNKGIEQLKSAIPLSQEDSDKLSQLQALHYACIYMRKHNLISKLQINNNITQNDDIFKHLVGSQFGMSDTIHGFIIALSRTGHLVYVSDNVINYLGHSSIDVLLSADKFCDILHPLDEQTVNSVLESEPTEQNNHFEFYTSWYVSKIRRRVYTRSDTKVKISGRFIANNSLFIALCTPMLRVADRDYMDYLVAASPTCFTTVHSLDLKFLEICEKGQTILGYTETELKGANLYEMTNFNNLKELRKNHKSLLSNKSQRGKLETVQLLMKNGSYLNCLVNMHYGNNNYIVCRFQAFSSSEMVDYENYSSMIQSYSSQMMTDDGEGSDQLQMSPTDGSDVDQFYAVKGKRRARSDEDDYEEEESSESDESQLNNDYFASRSSPKRKCVEFKPTPMNQQQQQPIVKTEPFVNASMPIVYQNNFVIQQQQQQQQQFYAQPYNFQQFTYQTQAASPIAPVEISEEMLNNLLNSFTNSNNNADIALTEDALGDIDFNAFGELFTNTDNFPTVNDDSNHSQLSLPFEQQQQDHVKYTGSPLNTANDTEFLDQLLALTEDFERCH